MTVPGDEDLMEKIESRSDKFDLPSSCVEGRPGYSSKKNSVFNEHCN
jgi:hypothetical protein